MKLGDSIFIAEAKPACRELLKGLLDKYPFASILVQDASQKSCAVSRRLTSVSMGGRFSARGFVVKVFDGEHWSEHSFSHISPETVPELLERISATAAMSKAVLPDGIRERVYSAPKTEKLTFHGGTDYEIDPDEVGDGEIISRLTALRDRGLAVSEKILDCQANLVWQKNRKLYLAPDRELEQNVLWTTGTVLAVAAKGQEIKMSRKGFSTLGGAELMDSMDAGVEDVSRVTLELLDSEPLTPGEYECVCTPEVTGMIVHEAFGHGVEMDMFVKKRALAEKYVGEYVASPLVTMHDGAAVVPETGSYFFDDEGTMAQDTVIIEKGVLRRGISDYLSAMTLGAAPTGNGRRESYRRKAYTRMTNTYFEAGTDKVEDMIASVKDGLLLCEPSSGMEDPKNWGIQCMVSYAREIKDGKLTGRIFSPIVLTGYVPDLLKSITMMSDGLELGGGGMCGKGYKEWVKVSDGGPWIKARIRLG